MRVGETSTESEMGAAAGKGGGGGGHSRSDFTDGLTIDVSHPRLSMSMQRSASSMARILTLGCRGPRGRGIKLLWGIKPMLGVRGSEVPPPPRGEGRGRGENSVLLALLCPTVQLIGHG